jgi:hypothetical protein
MGCGRKRLRPDLIYCPDICLAGLWKTVETCQDKLKLWLRCKLGISQIQAKSVTNWANVFGEISTVWYGVKLITAEMFRSNFNRPYASQLSKMKLCWVLWRIWPPVLWCCIVQKQPDISEECIAHIFRVEELSLPPSAAGFLFACFFHPKDEGNMFLRNVRLSTNYAAL